MKVALRAALGIIILSALVATYFEVQKDEQAPQPAAESPPPERLLAERIRALPTAPPTWQLIESAPEELNDPNLPDIRPYLRDLISSATERIVIESYILHQSWGKSAAGLMKSLKKGVHVLAVIHPNTMNDLAFIDDLRGAGADLVERDLAPLGGNPEVGYIHAKFIVADGRRGYLGSANLNGASMTENREIGLAFDDPRLAQNLEMIASLDAGHSKSVAAVEVPSAILTQGAPDKMLVGGLPRCDDAIAALCDLAQREIDIMMFTFTHQFGRYENIALPIRGAVRRGVKVRLIHDGRTLDELDGVRPTLKDLQQWGVEIRVADIAKLGKSPFGHYHAKALRVDDEYLMVGSNNWTDAASMENRETAVVLRSTLLNSRLAAAFSSDWNSGRLTPFLAK